MNTTHKFSNGYLFFVLRVTSSNSPTTNSKTDRQKQTKRKEEGKLCHASL